MIDVAQSKWVQALFTLIINLGTSYVVSDVQNILQGIFEYKFMKWLVVFAICFASTKDVYVSLCISFVFAITMWFFLDEKSDLSIPRVKTLVKNYVENHFVDENTINNSFTQ